MSFLGALQVISHLVLKMAVKIDIIFLSYQKWDDNIHLKDIIKI